MQKKTLMIRRGRRAIYCMHYLLKDIWKKVKILLVLNKYENAILSQIPAQLASVSDMSILEKEKGLIPEF